MIDLLVMVVGRPVTRMVYRCVFGKSSPHLTSVSLIGAKFR
jgi:hypothetical protein